MTHTTNMTNPIILSIDTSCDETSVAITKGLNILSNIVWSQSKVHAKWGGVVPNEAARQHEMKFSWVLKSAVNKAKIDLKNVDAISVTVGPGLAVALGVGIKNAKELALKYNKPLIATKHLEGHLLSALAESRISKQITNFKLQKQKGLASYLPPTLRAKRLFSEPEGSPNWRSEPEAIYHIPTFPAFGVVVSGGNTLLVLIEKIGRYKVLAQTIDDALGESLDKSARLLGLGYPGGAILEKFACVGNPKKYPLPIPMLGRENEGHYSYSGLKTAFSRLYQTLSEKGVITKSAVYDLAASYQSTAFEHFIRVTSKTISAAIPIYNIQNTTYLLVGGGVAANVEFRKKVRTMCKNLNITPLFPYTKKLYGDNAAMIGIAAYFKYLKNDFIDPKDIDRLPNLKIDTRI